jgi:hypothetical protein
LHGCTDKSHECIRMNATCSVNANVSCSNNITLYSNHITNIQISSPVEKYLPSLRNLMYNCSSSVKDLTPKQPIRATLLRLTQPQTHFSITRIWITARYSNHNWRSKTKMTWYKTI